MTVQTTTLPAANPVRLGSQPIRRQAFVPRVAVVAAPPPEEAPPEEQQSELAYASAELDVVVPGDDGCPNDDDAPTQVDSQEAAPLVEPPRRGRGRPRKPVVDVIAEGRPAPRRQHPRVVTPPTPDVVTYAPADLGEPLDLIALGRIMVQAKAWHMTPDAYIDGIRDMVAAYDRLFRAE